MHSRSLVIVAAALACGAIGCDEGAPSPMEPMGLSPDFRPRSAPLEFVGITVSRRADEAGFLEVVGPIFGEEARGGTLHTDFVLQDGLLLTVTPDERTADQVVVTLAMQAPDAGDRRLVARLPVSLAYGQVFIDTVRAAMVETALDPEAMNSWHLEYTAVSANGGRLIIQAAFDEDSEVTQLSFETQNPRTSLVPGLVNTAALEGEPFEKISGTVLFELSRDEFDFFSARAYGTTSGAAQNFADFQLQPHRWLRLTVTPRLEDELVDVGFEVVTTDGRRLALARAPASLLAGEQFRENVFLMVDNMLAQEASEAGSSMPFAVPFHYDDPEGGGVVNVIAEGQGGVFRIAYAVESPIQRLREVEFVPYVGEIIIPETPPPPTETSCREVGSTDALSGTFRVTFDASPTVRDSASLTDPLRGPVWGSVYRAADVTIGGPREGAEPLGDFFFEDVDITDPSSLAQYTLDFTVPAGRYQMLGFMDIDGNADPANADPDAGDPVAIPIGAYTMECEEQPVVVEFALLLPEGR